MSSNARLLAPLLRLSIKPLLMVPLKSFGFNTCEQICRFPQSLLLPFGVIILVLPISQPILSSMLVLSMLKWIITLSVTALPRKRFRFILFPFGINLSISSLNRFLLHPLLLFGSSFGLIPHPQLEEAYYRMYNMYISE